MHPLLNAMEVGSLGLIFHWGPYSVPAYDSLEHARDRKIKNGSEWYAHRLYSTWPVSGGNAATKRCHALNYPGLEYQDFAYALTAARWDPRDWCRLAKNVGATYIVITAKHHDGYCMWSTPTAPGWNAGDLGPRRDVVGELERECRRVGLLFGVYYSLLEWDWMGKPGATTKAKGVVTPVSKDRVRKVHTQIDELLERYKPDVWWFDGDWAATADKWRTAEIVARIMKKTPNVQINDRLGDGGRYLGTFRASPDRWIPLEDPGGKWESIHTIGHSWGLNVSQRDGDYKTGKQLLELRERVGALGGRLLLNLGPDREGVLDSREVAALYDMVQLRRVGYG